MFPNAEVCQYFWDYLKFPATECYLILCILSDLAWQDLELLDHNSCIHKSRSKQSSWELPSSQCASSRWWEVVCHKMDPRPAIRQSYKCEEGHATVLITICFVFHDWHDGCPRSLPQKIFRCVVRTHGEDNLNGIRQPVIDWKRPEYLVDFQPDLCRNSKQDLTWSGKYQVFKDVFFPLMACLLHMHCAKPE
jgi:hypothetical protein